MTIRSTRKITTSSRGDIDFDDTYSAAENIVAPGQTELRSLASGANTITVPTGGSTPTACTIIPPAANAVTITLKGVTGDTGVQLHSTDPTSLAIDDSVTTFCLTAGDAIDGVRLVWT